MNSLRRTATGLGALVLAAAAMLVGAGSSTAASDIDEVMSQCASEVTVCQIDGASIPNTPEVAAALPDGVRVVVVSRDQAQSVLRPQKLAEQFKSETGASTVIVVEARPQEDLFFVASDGDATAIATALNSKGELDAQVIQEVLTAPPPAEPGIPVGGIIGGGLGLVLVAGVAGAVLLRRRRGKARDHRAKVAARRLADELEYALNGPDGAFVRTSIEGLHQRAQELPGVGGQLSSLADHVSDLFVRVHSRGTDQQLRLLQSEYKGTLAKLLKALGDDYYGDIIANPHYWSDPAGRSAEVLRAVQAVDHEAVENIRRFNESRDLDFKVALDSLNKSVTEAKLSDVYGDRRQEET